VRRHRKSNRERRRSCARSSSERATMKLAKSEFIVPLLPTFPKDVASSELGLGRPASRRPTGNRSRERTRWWGKRRRGRGPWLRHWWGKVPVGCGTVPSALGVCSGSYGPSVYVFVDVVVEATAVGVCWSCVDALQSAAFLLAEARLRLAASLASVGRDRKTVN
jgi:hypothetical protein